MPKYQSSVWKSKTLFPDFSTKYPPKMPIPELKIKNWTSRFLNKNFSLTFSKMSILGLNIKNYISPQNVHRKCQNVNPRLENQNLHFPNSQQNVVESFENDNSRVENQKLDFPNSQQSIHRKCQNDNSRVGNQKLNFPISNKTLTEIAKWQLLFFQRKDWHFGIFGSYFVEKSGSTMFLFSTRE